MEKSKRRLKYRVFDSSNNRNTGKLVYKFFT